MTTVIANVRVRPLRLLFIVQNAEQLQEAIQMNTSVWGGIYNLIALVSGLPDDATKIERYVDISEPDAIVLLTDLAVAIPNGFRVIQRDHFYAPGLPGGVAIGISANDIYEWLYQQEYRFMRHEEGAIFASPGDNDLVLFNATCFGDFPADRRLKEQFTQALHAKEKYVGARDLIDVLHSQSSPLYLGSKGLEIRRLGKSKVFRYLFLHDGRNPADLIDFWNFRALGWNVVPVPVQWLNLSLIEPLLNLLNSGPRMEVVMAESSRQTTADLCNLLGEPAISKLCSWNVASLQTGQQANRCEVSAAQSQIEVAVNRRGEFTLKTTGPGFRVSASLIFEFGLEWAMVLNLNNHDEDLSRYTVFPPEVRDVSSLLIRTGDRTCHQNSEGIVFLVASQPRTQPCRLPSAETIFSWWLGTRGWSGQPSDKGRMGREMITALGGLPGAKLISSIAVLEELNSMAQSDNSNSALRSRKQWIDVLRQVHQEMVVYDELSLTPVVGVGIQCTGCSRTSWLDVNSTTLVYCQVCSEPLDERICPEFKKYIKNAEERLLHEIRDNDSLQPLANQHFDKFLQRGILKLGLQLKCGQCHRRTWCSLEEISETMNCVHCLRSNTFPLSDPSNNALWRYKTQGTFSIAEYAQGQYSVVLALRFLSNTLRGNFSWVCGFEMNLGTGPIDCDLAFWGNFTKFDSARQVLVWGECKSFNDLKDKDADRLKLLGELVKGSTVLYATLKREPSSSELKKLIRVKNDLDRQGSNLLILTGVELFGDLSAPTCWKQAGGTYATLADTVTGPLSLQALCEKTQQMHLKSGTAQ